MNDGAGSRQIPPSPGLTAPNGSIAASSTPLYHRFGLVPCSGDRWLNRSLATIWEMGVVGSSRSPEMMAPSGHTTTQAGSSPTSTLCTQ